LPRAPLGKLFAERLCRFTECFWHSANLLHPVVIVVRAPSPKPSRLQADTPGG
jgi:hypothetical protein